MATVRKSPIVASQALQNGVVPTLTKAELADLLFDRVGFNKRESKEMVDAFFDVMVDALCRSVEVKLSGFGQFSIRNKAARPGRNPRTGEVIPIDERQVVTFHASPKLKAMVQGDAARQIHADT